MGFTWLCNPREFEPDWPKTFILWTYDLLLGREREKRASEIGSCLKLLQKVSYLFLSCHSQKLMSSGSSHFFGTMSKKKKKEKSLWMRDLLPEYFCQKLICSPFSTCRTDVYIFEPCSPGRERGTPGRGLSLSKSSRPGKSTNKGLFWSWVDWIWERKQRVV
jgi:hypothetical protein